MDDYNQVLLPVMAIKNPSTAIFYMGMQYVSACDLPNVFSLNELHIIQTIKL